MQTHANPDTTPSKFFKLEQDSDDVPVVRFAEACRSRLGGLLSEQLLSISAGLTSLPLDLLSVRF